MDVGFTESLVPDTGVLMTSLDNRDEFLISDEAMVYLHIIVVVILQGVLTLIGIVSNLINIIVFKQLGLKDSMTMGFFALSLSDLLCNIFNMPFCVLAALEVAQVYNVTYINVIVNTAFMHTRYIAYFSSYWITMFISMEMCVCVTFPFQVRRLFTKTRCIAAMSFIIFVNIGLNIPFYTSHRVSFEVVHESLDIENVTEASRVMEVNYYVTFGNLGVIIDISHIVLAIVCNDIIIVCSIWMITALKNSSSIRNDLRKPGYADKRTNPVEIKEGRSDFTSTKMGSNLSDRERKVLKLVTCLAVYQVLCNLPGLFAFTVYHAFTKYRGSWTANFETTFYRFGELFQVIYVSMSFLVYFNLNKSYRNRVKKMFAWI